MIDGRRAPRPLPARTIGNGTVVEGKDRVRYVVSNLGIAWRPFGMTLTRTVPKVRGKKARAADKLRRRLARKATA